jgi:nucleotide-binding universal stress UspA family protein
MMRIVALLDRSIYRKSVVDHAAWIAATANGTVDLLFVVARNEHLANRMPAHPTGAIILSDGMTIDDELARIRESGEVVLAEAAAALNAMGIDDVRTRIEEGNVEDVAVTAGADADLVVIGKRGEHADLARLPLGANVESIVRRCPVPVLVVSRSFRPVHRALVAFDLDDSCRAVIDVLAGSRIVPPMPVLLVHVGPETADMRTALSEAANRLEQAGHDATVEIAAGIPQQVIPERAVTDATDLVVMGAYGRSRLKSLIFGSLTNEVIRGTQTPVLLAHHQSR